MEGDSNHLESDGAQAAGGSSGLPPPASLAGGGEGESPVAGPILDGQHNSGRGCSGELGRAAVRGAGAGVAEAAHQRLGTRPATLVLWSTVMLGASQPAQAKPWLDRRLLAAIPFLPVVTILAGTAVPMPRSPARSSRVRSRLVADACGGRTQSRP